MTQTTSAQNTGVAYHYNAHKDIHGFHVWDMKPSTIDTWYDLLSQTTATAYTDQQHLCCIYFIYGVWLTPYAIKRILDFSRSAPSGMKSSSAIVHIGCSEEIIRMFEDTLRQLPVYPLYERRMFLFAGEAEAWFKERRQTL